MPAPPAVGFVILWTDDPPAQVVARLGEERPDVTAGYGGWEEVARPRRSTVTSWAGQPARRLTLPILLDGWATNTPVEHHIRQLERMALPRPGGEPPTIRFNAHGNHLPGKEATWVIDALSWDDALMNAEGERTRQAATLELLEFISDDVIEARTRKSSAQRRRARANAKSGKGKKKNSRDKRKHAGRNRRSVRKPKTHTRAITATAFDGEDLMAIAARELDDVRRWREIADLNGIRDPRAVKVGQILRMP